MADPAADVDLDSVIDRLLEGEFVWVCVVFVCWSGLLGVVESIGSAEEGGVEGGGLGNSTG
jgi:hypothetical protein